jgi:thioredoxin 1
MKASKILTVSLAFLAVGSFIIFAGQKAANDGPQCGNQTAQAACTDNTSKTGEIQGGGAAPVKSFADKAPKAPEKLIMFFMNPNGHPCQMQLSILDGMKDKLVGLATIKYVKTTEASDQETFYKFGIRGLPSLIILDNNGKEVKRFTPGIQDEKTVLSALSASNK